MPEISRFYGIRITMFGNDHAPQHFHAGYAGETAEVGIQPIMFLRGSLPPRAASLVLEWAAVHQQELSKAWTHLRAGQEPSKIEPLG